MPVLKRTKDDVWWIKHVTGDEQLVAHLKAVPDGSRHRFAIGEREGTFEKLRAGKNARPMNGFKPVGEVRDWWQRSKHEAAGTVVPIAYLGPEE
jgi:hypothetical protein